MAMEHDDDGTVATARGRSTTVSRVLDVTGRSLIVLGLLMLGFVGYQLWGTGISEAREQQNLEQQFELPRLESAIPESGDVVGRIRIPSLRVDKMVVAGVSWKALKKGPGLFPNSPLPGQYGNVAIAGHRTSFGAPFARINELDEGDVIELETSSGTHTYTVTGPPRVVPPTAVDVVRTVDEDRAMLTLVSCHPKWTASKRIVVTAEMTPENPPASATPVVLASDSEEAFSAGWFHEPGAIPAVVAFALLLAIIAAAARNLVRMGYRRVAVYPIMGTLFVLTLYPFYENVARLLPTNI